jgi:hypothetical protein
LISIKTASSPKRNSTCHHHGHLAMEWKVDLQAMVTEERDLKAMDQKADAHLHLERMPDRMNHAAAHHAAARLEVNPVATVGEADLKVAHNPKDLHPVRQSSNPKTPLRSHLRSCQRICPSNFAYLLENKLMHISS